MSKGKAAMTPKAFIDWQARMGWSVSRAALELGLQERQVYCYRSGQSVIPEMTRRFCALLERVREISEMTSSILPD